MKKLTLLLAMAVISLSSISQESFKDTYKRYLNYCDELVSYETTQRGQIQQILIPVHDEAGELERFVSGQEKDTTWLEVDPPEYRDNHSDNNTIYFNGSVGIGSLDATFTLSNYGESIEIDKFIKVERPYNCMIKREKHSHEGFFKWFYEVELK